MNYNIQYFNSLSKYIQQNPQLIGSVLESILDLTMNNVLLNQITSCNWLYNNENINHWRIEIDSLVGGESISPRKSVLVQITLPPNSIITDYLPGGQKRKLLEETLYPNFIGADVDCYTEIKLEGGPQAFIVEEEPYLGRIGISTII